jgi:predicted Zn-dependent protease
MGMALSQNGSLPQAIASLDKTVHLSPSFTLASGFLAAAYVRAGNVGEAKKVIGRVLERTKRHFVSPSCLAVYHAALGEADRMFEFLRAARAERDPYLTRMNSEPYFEAFSRDPRYRELLREMDLD